jgi:hypothetical protein
MGLVRFEVLFVLRVFGKLFLVKDIAVGVLPPPVADFFGTSDVPALLTHICIFYGRKSPT